VPQAVHIKLFHDIPLADLEVVFPFKTVTLKYVNLLTSLISIAVGLWLVLTKLREDDGLSATVLQGVAALVVAKAGAIVNDVRMARITMEREMQRTFVHKSKDNDEGALFYLLERWDELELKQLLLAYAYALALDERGLFGTDGAHIDDIAAAIEADLAEQLHLRTTFNAEAAMVKLERHRLVTRRGHYVLPVPLPEAVRLLEERWGSLRG
jgi:hypothetical protein